MWTVRTYPGSYGLHHVDQSIWIPGGKYVRTVITCVWNLWLRRAKSQNSVTLLAKNESHFRQTKFYTLKQGVLLVLHVIWGTYLTPPILSWEYAQYVKLNHFPLIGIEYRIIDKPSTSVNPMSNTILEQIHQVLGDLVLTCNITQNYVEKYNPWLGILSAAAISISLTTNRLKGYSPVQLVFVCDMIILIKHMVDQ